MIRKGLFDKNADIFDKNQKDEETVFICLGFLV